METQQSLSGVSLPVRSKEAISSLSSSVETPEINPAGSILALLRLLFAFSLVVLTTRGARLSGANSEITSAILWGYFFLSAALLTGLLTRIRFAESVHHYSAWIDLCCFASLLLFTKGANLLLFGAFWLAILTAYHVRDRYAGLIVTIAGALILSADLLFNFGSTTFSLGVQPKLAEIVALVGSPLILGILAFHWKRQKLTLDRRVGLLLDVSDFSNPRFGVEWSLSTLLEKVRAFLSRRWLRTHRVSGRRLKLPIAS